MGIEQYMDKLRKSILAKERTERPPKNRSQRSFDFFC
jgi:hypothetical protein